MFLSFDQEDRVHDAHSQAEHQELEHTHTVVGRLHHLLPHVRSDVDEVARYEGQDVYLGHLPDLPQSQPEDYAHQIHPSGQGVAHDGLAAGELALQQDAHVPHIVGDRVCENCDQNWDILIDIS